MRDVLADLVLGRQGYVGLKRRLLRAGPRFLWESALSQNPRRRVGFETGGRAPTTPGSPCSTNLSWNKFG